MFMLRSFLELLNPFSTAFYLGSKSGSYFACGHLAVNTRHCRRETRLQGMPILSKFSTRGSRAGSGARQRWVGIQLPSYWLTLLWQVMKLRKYRFHHL